MKNLFSSLADLFREFREKIELFYKQKGFWKKIAFLYSVYFVGILSIVQANYLYKTDIQRVAERGESNWTHSGRFINDFLVWIFHFDSYPQDISPLSQLIAIFFLSLSSLVLVNVICKKTNYFTLFLSTILGLSPYYLQVISYNFDCLFYSISFFVSILPFLFFKEDKLFYVSSAFCLLFVYASWQANVAVYMIVCTYLFSEEYLLSQASIKQVFKKLLFTITVFFSTSLLYVALVHLNFGENAVVLQQSHFCPIKDCKDIFVSNFNKATTGYFIRHWKNTPMGWAFSLVLLCFFFYQTKKAWLSKRSCKLFNFFVSFSSFALMLFFILLWTMFFTFIYWNARVWMGFGACFAVMMLSMTNEENVFCRRLFLFFSIALMWGCIIFANRVGNLLEIQKRYESFRWTLLAQDLAPYNKPSIIITGGVHSPIVKQKFEHYPILYDLVTAMQARFIRTFYHFVSYYRPDAVVCRNKKFEASHVLVDNAYHKITQINSECLKIDLK